MEEGCTKPENLWRMRKRSQEIPWLESKPQGKWKNGNRSARRPTHSQELGGWPEIARIRSTMLMKFEVMRKYYISTVV
ncbi:hypothetical protein V6N11_022388 [Hibiscus sabdariffa]|uniref:Uncharacterized protein n=1 Tax=Hibiscus sabdariffa TaxID=183260 RepID=A0ABR2TJS0_9ROSI